MPKSEWTARNLLYYDKIGTIAPSEYQEDPEQCYGSFMLNLIRNELVIPINPIDVIDDPIPFNSHFLRYIQENSEELIKRQQVFSNTRDKIYSSKFHWAHVHFIENQKFERDLLYSLADLGLAEELNTTFYEVERVTAVELMFYLATIIGNKLKMLPATHIDFNRGFMNNSPILDEAVDLKRNRLLKELIPYPYYIDFNQLLRFKEKNYDSLIRFRNAIEKIAFDPIYDNEDLFNEKIEEMQNEKELLVEKMSSGKLGKILFGSVCGIYGAFEGLAMANTPGAIIGGLPGFSSAIYSAIQAQKDNNVNDYTGVKYLSLLQKIKQ